MPGALEALTKLLAKEAPALQAQIERAVANSASSGLEHQVVGAPAGGGFTMLGKGTDSTITPKAHELAMAIQTARGHVVDAHTHPGAFPGASADDRNYYKLVYGKHLPEGAELRSIIVRPPEAHHGADYSFFATPHPEIAFSDDPYQAARYELQRAATRGPWGSQVQRYFDGTDIDPGDVMESLSPLLLQRLYEQRGLGRASAHLSAPIVPNTPGTATLNSFTPGALEVLSQRGFARGGLTCLAPARV